MIIKMVAAIGKKRELGYKNHLIWIIPPDLRFFRKVTLNHKVIMGRRTFESIGRPLPKRVNIVLSKGMKEIEDVIVIDDLDELKNLCDEQEVVYVIGGESVYRQFLPLADEIILTHIEDELNCADAFFPEINRDDYIEELEGEYEYKGLKYFRKIYHKKAD